MESNNRAQVATPAAAAASREQAFRRVAYLQMEPQTGLASLKQIDGSLFSHLVLLSAQLDLDANKLVLANEPDSLKYLNELDEFKRNYPKVKVIISVGNEDNNLFACFQLLEKSNELRQKFAKETIEFLQHFHLDGLDINLANSLQSDAADRLALVKAIKLLRSSIVESYYARKTFEEHKSSSTSSSGYSNSTSGALLVEPHLLTVAISGHEALLRSASPELRQLANLCDWLNVMSFDYFLFKAYAPFTGPTCPLQPLVEPYVPIISKLALSSTVARLLDDGLQPDKLVMAVPTFARAYRLLFRSSSPAPFSLALGLQHKQASSQTGDAERLCYREVVEILGRDGSALEFDERARVPYLLCDNGYTWISFENSCSVREKVRYLFGQNLGGYATFNLNYDDFLGDQDDSQDEFRAQNGTSSNSSPVSGQFRKSTFPLHRAMLDELETSLANCQL